MTSSRNLQLLRILGMIRDLSTARSGVSIGDLRDCYGVTRRTVERDLAAIEAAGYEVETLPAAEPGRVRKRIPSGSGGMNLPVTADELAAARAGVAALERDAPAALAATLRMLVNRLEESQAIAVAVDADALAGTQAFIPRPGPIANGDAAVIGTITAAILQCQRLRITYRKGGTEPPRDYVAEPYGLLYGANTYLVWRGTEDGEWRKFALRYIDRIEPTGEPFVHEPSFNLKDFANEAFGVYRQKPFEAVLRILPSGVERLRDYQFHPTQSVEPRPDGGATVRFTASGLTEICWELFTWGEHLQPLHPAHLVDFYREMLCSALSTTACAVPLPSATALSSLISSGVEP